MNSKVETDLFPWILVGLLTCAAAVAGVFYTNRAITPDNPNLLTVAPPSDLASRPPTAPVTAHQTAAASSANRIWECVQNGTRTFSDSPCGDRAQSLTLNTINRMPAESAPRTPASYVSPPPSYQPESFNRFDDPRVDSTECEYLREAINDIRERMRHRYTSSEGNYFRERLHALDDRQYALDCER